MSGCRRLWVARSVSVTGGGDGCVTGAVGRVGEDGDKGGSNVWETLP